MSGPRIDWDQLRLGSSSPSTLSENVGWDLACKLYGEGMTQKRLCEPAQFPDEDGAFRLTLWASWTKPPSTWVGDTEVRLVVHLPGPGAIEAIQLAGELAFVTGLGPEGPKTPLITELRLMRGEEVLVRAPAGWWFDTPIRVPEGGPIDIVTTLREPVRVTHVKPHLYPFGATLIVRTPVAYPRIGWDPL